MALLFAVVAFTIGSYLSEALSKLKFDVNQRVETVYMDGNTPYVAHVEEMHDAFPTEMYFRFVLTPLLKKHINATHIKIPYGTLLNMQYIKQFRGYEETGVIRAQVLKQSMGFFSPNNTVAFVEKRHVMSTTYQLDQHATLFSKQASSVDLTTEEKNEALVKVRRSLASYFGNPSHGEDILGKHPIGASLSSLASLLVIPGAQLIQASGIPNKEATDFALSSEAVPETCSARLDALRNKIPLSLTAGNFNVERSLYSMINCFHFDGVVQDDHENVMVFPLNKLLPAFRGETTETPYEWHDVLQGQVFFKHHSAGSDDFVEIYFGAVIHTHAAAPDAAIVNERFTVRIGPASGVGGPVKISSKNEIGPSSLGHLLYRTSLWYPQDERFLWTASCSEDQKTAGIERRKELDEQNLFMRLMEGTGTPFDAFSLFDFGMQIFPCGASYVVPDHVDSARATMILLSAWNHAAMEMPAGAMMDFFGADWNLL